MRPSINPDANPSFDENRKIISHINSILTAIPDRRIGQEIALIIVFIAFKGREGNLLEDYDRVNTTPRHYSFSVARWGEYGGRHLGSRLLAEIMTNTFVSDNEPISSVCQQAYSYLSSSQEIQSSIDRAIAELGMLIESLDFKAADAFASLYVDLLYAFERESKFESDYRNPPRDLAKLIQCLIKDHSFSSVLDPTCFTGTLLIEVGKYADKKNVRLCGQALSLQSSIIARLNLSIHGFDNSRIEVGNPIQNAAFDSESWHNKFDLVVSIPPFQMPLPPHLRSFLDDRFYRLKLGEQMPTAHADFAFLAHMLESVNPHNGLIITVVPTGVLYRSGAEGRIREKLVRDNLIEAVIYLPKNTFFYASINTCLLIIKRAKENNSDILLINLDNSKKATSALLEDSIRLTIEAYHEFKTDGKCEDGVGKLVKNGIGYRAPFEEIERNSFDLHVPRYVSVQEDVQIKDWKELKSEITALTNEFDTLGSEIDTLLIYPP
jgi:type I restriction-modification system DNA methylase subunit